jgi:hypothetical protein
VIGLLGKAEITEISGPIPYFAGNMPVKTTYKTIFVALYVHKTSK